MISATWMIITITRDLPVRLEITDLNPNKRHVRLHGGRASLDPNPTRVMLWTRVESPPNR